ncbi:MAG: beta-ketoacyl-[acyl-carrier-protein] synthase family protein [Verrucomicrobia bacterium]|nr:beta-ketoacyl-[acyl-carrier-protein] synthase family protein [Verrucomicrobiota bacterium]
MAASFLIDSEPSRRVVITGMGVIAPNGQDLGTFWNSIRKGISAAARVSKFDTSRLPHQVAAPITGFDSRRYMEAKMARRCDLSTQYALAAATLAVRDAALDLSVLDPDRLGVVEGTTVSSMESVLKGHKNYLTHGGYHLLSPMTVVNGYSGEGSSRLALALGIRGHAITYCSGCASGNDAVGYAFRMIQDDEVDLMVAGATDDMMIEPMYAGLCLLKVMTTRNDTPKEAMRPFDRTRDGFLLGEGAAFLVLEDLAHALLRGARVYAEVLGHGRSCEAYHPTDSHPDGIGFRRAMQKALRKARLHPSEVDYINAHGTATPTNDPIETRAIKAVFGEHARRLAISSTKPVTGHMMGASGAVETVITALALQHQELPPTINLNDPADECDLDYLPRQARPYPARVALNLSAGFGGKNSCLVLRAYRQQP